MALGIGLITSAIAFLITNFEKVRNVIYDLFPATKGLFDNMDRIKQIAMGVGNAILKFVLAPAKALIKLVQGDFQGALDAVKESIQFTKNFREGESKEIKSQADEREAARQEELKKQKDANKKKLEEQARHNEELRKQREQARQQFDAFIDDENEARLKKNLSSYQIELLELEKKYQRQFELAKKYGFKTSELEYLRFQNVVDIINKETAETKKGYDLKIDQFKQFLPKVAEYTSAIVANNNIVQNSDIATAENKEMMLQLIGNSMAAFSDLVGRQTVVGKALAIAEATINTYLAASKSLKADYSAFGPFALAAKIAATASTIAVGLAAVKNIVKTQVPGKGGGGSIGSISNISTVSPLTPALSPQAQATSLNAAAINNLGNNAIRAYILNADIQNQNQINDILKRNSTI